MSTDRPIEKRKPLSEWVPVPRWVLEKLAGDVAAQLNLKVWEVEGPRLCWSEDIAECARVRSGEAVVVSRERLDKLEFEELFGKAPIVHDWPSCGCQVEPPKLCDDAYHHIFVLDCMQQERDQARARVTELEVRYFLLRDNVAPAAFAESAGTPETPLLPGEDQADAIDRLVDKVIAARSKPKP